MFEAATEEVLLRGTDDTGEALFFLADETGDDLFEAATEDYLLTCTDETGEV